MESTEAHLARGAPEPPLHNLPVALSTFIGREWDIIEVKRLLGEVKNRLLTLTGPGGCGKTRLALAVAHEVVEDFEDGVWWVGLASLSDPDLVPQAVASSLGVRETPGRSLSEALVEALKSRGLLLILDNCEHLIDACAQLVDTLLHSCQDLKVLATSREALRVAGERSWSVPSLSVPDHERQPPIEELRRYEAVELFVERAAEVTSTFKLTEENSSAVARLCRRLDGIPLAIELAAARTNVLSVEQIANRLEDSFGLLSAGGRTAMPRHRTLHATMDWSHELLPEEERVLFRRLSVFAGGFTLEAVEEVCAGKDLQRGEVLELLSDLVNKSLVIMREESGEARYRLLESIRQYSWEKLSESSEADQVQERHAEYYLALAEEAAPELKGERQVAWLARLEIEHDNLQVAMRWLLGRGGSGKAARLGWALWLFWWIRAHFAEGRRSMEQALSAEGSAAMTASARAKVLYVAAAMANGQGDHRSAQPLAEESLRLFRERADKIGTAYALGNAAFAANGQGQHQRAITLIEEAVDLFLEEEEKWGAAMLHGFLAVAWRNQGDHGHAKRLAERGLALSREAGERQTISVALYTLATLVQAEQDRERARDLFEEALKLSAELGNEADVAQCLEGLASIAAADGRMVRAARLWGAEEALLEKIEGALYTYVPDRSLHQSEIAAARVQLEGEAFEAALAEGRQMTLEEATEYAILSKEEPLTAPPKDDEAGLSERELEVLRLVAEGLTDSQVADRLYLSRRTVGHHLSSVYRKLGVPSRAAAAKAALERGLI